MQEIAGWGVNRDLQLGARKHAKVTETELGSGTCMERSLSAGTGDGRGTKLSVPALLVGIA